MMPRNSAISLIPSSRGSDKKELSTRVSDMKFMQKSYETSQRQKLSTEAERVVEEAKWKNPHAEAYIRSIKAASSSRPSNATTSSFEELSETSGVAANLDIYSGGAMTHHVDAEGKVSLQDSLRDISLDRQQADISRLARGRRSFGQFNVKLETITSNLTGKGQAITDELDQVADEELFDVIQRSKDSQKRRRYDTSESTSTTAPTIKSSQTTAPRKSFMETLRLMKQDGLNDPKSASKDSQFVALVSDSEPEDDMSRRRCDSAARQHSQKAKNKHIINNLPPPNNSYNRSNPNAMPKNGHGNSSTHKNSNPFAGLPDDMSSLRDSMKRRR